MSSTTRPVRSTWWLAVLGLAALLTQPAAADSYVYFEPLAAAEAATIPAGQPATLRLPTETGPVAVQVSAFGYVVTEGTLPGEFVYVRLAVANGGDQPVTIDPAGAALTDDLGHRLVGAALYSGRTPLASTTVAPGGRDEVVLGFALTAEAPIEALGSAVVEWPFAYGDTPGMAVAAFLKTGAGPGAAASTEGAAAIASYPSEAFAPAATTAGVPVVLAAPPRTEIITTYVEYEYFTPAVPIWYAPVWRPWRPYAYDYYWSNGWCIPVYEPWSPWRHNDWHSGFFFSFSWFGGHDRDRHDRYDRYDRYDRGRSLTVVAGRDATVFVNQPVTINIASAGPALDRASVARRVLAGRDRARDLADRDGRIASLQSPTPAVTAADLRRDVADRREVILGSQARLDERRAATVPGRAERPADLPRAAARTDIARRDPLRQAPAEAVTAAAPVQAAPQATTSVDRTQAQRAEQIRAAQARLDERRAATVPGRAERPATPPRVAAPATVERKAAVRSAPVEAPKTLPQSVAPSAAAPSQVASQAAAQAAVQAERTRQQVQRTEQVRAAQAQVAERRAATVPGRAERPVTPPRIAAPVTVERKTAVRPAPVQAEAARPQPQILAAPRTAAPVGPAAASRDTGARTPMVRVLEPRKQASEPARAAAPVQPVTAPRVERPAPRAAAAPARVEVASPRPEPQAQAVRTAPAAPAPRRKPPPARPMARVPSVSAAAAAPRASRTSERHGPAIPPAEP